MITNTGRSVQYISSSFNKPCDKYCKPLSPKLKELSRGYNSKTRYCQRRGLVYANPGRRPPYHMASSARSHNGCWTCRLRKKKCDEKNPSCQLCKSLLLTCYGYGPKPEWMDGAAAERKVATEIQHQVKQETRRKQKLRMEAKRHTDRSPERAQVNIDAAVVPSSLQSRLNHKINGGAWTAPASAGASWIANPSASTNTLEEEEGLVMHYLDYVFPLQFRFYQPSPFEGGRGWLLSIILRTKPLYYAAITLSAFHRQILTCTGPKPTDVRCDMDRLLGRYAAAIKELRLFIERFSTNTLPETLSELVEILACTVILISLELFNGNDADNWQVHLMAATSLIPILQKHSMICTYPELSPVYKSALYFFGGALAWYDILSFATTKAKVTTRYPCLGPGSGYKGYIQLEKIMGCQNWAMLAILDIATLGEKKEAMVREGNLVGYDLEAEAAEIAEIKQRLEDGLADNTSRKHETKDIQAVTNIFALSALIYLHVVASGADPALDSIRAAVRRTVVAFRKIPDRALLRYLVWPICITACMATEEHYNFFTEMPIPVYGMSLKAMEVIRECWRLRRSNTSATRLVDWNTAMQSLGLHVLLV